MKAFHGNRFIFVMFAHTNILTLVHTGIYTIKKKARIKFLLFKDKVLFHDTDTTDGKGARAGVARYA